jgi:hypothetical protein
MLNFNERLHLAVKQMIHHFIDVHLLNSLFKALDTVIH